MLTYAGQRVPKKNAPRVESQGAEKRGGPHASPEDGRMGTLIPTCV